MKIINLLSLFWVGSNAFSQTYLHPTTGIANENVGTCLEATCTGTYLDDGGAAGNYSDNIGGPITYRVFLS